MTSLRDLDASVATVNYGGEVVLSMLMFLCPNPRCDGSHSQGIPFSDEPFHEVPDLHCASYTVKVWQRVSGSGPDDITLVPSVVVPSCDGLHGFIRDGNWVPC